MPASRAVRCLLGHRPPLAPAYAYASVYASVYARFSTAPAPIIDIDSIALPSARGVVFDVRLIESQPELVAAHLQARHSAGLGDLLLRMAELNRERKRLIVERDTARTQRKILSAQIGDIMKSLKAPTDATSATVKDTVSELKAAVERASGLAHSCDEARTEADRALGEMFSELPNLLDDGVPVGPGEESNVVVYSWGDISRYSVDSNTDSSTSSTSSTSSASADSNSNSINNSNSYSNSNSNSNSSSNSSSDSNSNNNTNSNSNSNVPPLALAHDDIATRMGTLLLKPAVLMAGPRSSVLTGPLARLERALISYFLDFHTGRGYTEISVPYLVSASTLQGTGQLPKFKEDLFHVSNHSVGENEGVYLIPTAEVPVLAVYRQELLPREALPIRHVCYSPCFRAEAGAAGRDTRGLIRQHQFHKVELIKICVPEDSEREHMAMVSDVEALLMSLGLPHRRVLLSSGDIGFSARICYDIEVWFPSQACYREISSVSNCWEFQARRLGLRYRLGLVGKEKMYPHTINGSGVAVGRALAAVLENFQRAKDPADPQGGWGCVDIPLVLRPYMGGMETMDFKL
jgi:seryl-tRNA synthetase